MTQLQEDFVDALDHLELPETDIVAGVLARLEGDPGEPIGPVEPNLSPGRSRTRVLALVAVAVVAAVGLTLAVTPAGQAVADWFGIGNTAFEIDENSTPVDEGSDPATEGSDPATELNHSDDLGSSDEPVPNIVAIESLGLADAVVDHPQRGRTFIWNEGPGQQIRLSVRSTTQSVLSTKSLAAADDVEFLTIDGPDDGAGPRSLPGAWIGASHQLSFPVEGLDLELTVDAGPVLIWVDGEVELRLEGASGKAEALAWATETTEGTVLLAAE